MKRILIVDDEAPLRLLYKVTLQKSGYAVDAAGDGEEALRLIAASSYDLIVTDMSMPGNVDGLAVAGEAASRNIPSILCTAYQSEETRKKAGATATVILEKPVTPRMLAEEVGRLLAE